MIPKVNKFDFFSYEAIGGKIIQLVGESNDKFEPAFLTKNQISKIEKRVKYCGILSSIEFIIDSYGLVNFFVDYNDELENFKSLKEFLFEFNDFQSIAYIEKSLQFLEENTQEFEELKSYPDDFEAKHGELEKKINFKNTLNQTTVLMDNEIRKKPDNFCYDELGTSINPYFSGNLKRFYPSGLLKHEYNFLNGRVHGEGIDYDFYGRKERLVLFENGKRIRVLKRWDKEGNEK